MRIILFVNSAKTFFWHRKPLADKLVREGHEVVVVCADDGPVERFKTQPYRTIIVDMSRKGMNPFSELLILKKLYSIFKEVKPDLCHNFTIKCVIYGSIVQRISGCKRIVNTITGLGYAFIKGGFIQKFVEILFKVSLRFSNSSVIFQNNDDYSLFLENNIISPEKAYLIPGSGVNTDFYKPTAKEKGIINILFAGRILKSKGVLELLKASIELFEMGYVHNIYLAGELDPMNPDTLTDMDLKLFGKFGHIKFLGNIDDMRPYYAQADFACLPSYREGLPKFLLEAMSCSLPIITTDTAGCRELIDGNGYLVPIKDQVSLKRALEKMMISRDEMTQMGKRSRELVLRSFSEDKILSQIVGLYN